MSDNHLLQVYRYALQNKQNAREAVRDYLESKDDHPTHQKLDYILSRLGREAYEAIQAEAEIETDPDLVDRAGKREE